MESHGADQQQRLQRFLDLERQPPAKPPLRTTNDVSDIDGAKPLLKNHVFVHKAHFYDAHDIRGSVSKELHPRNRRVGDDDRFKQLPIEGSTSQPSGFHTNRVVNPLAPEYKLPSFTSAPPLEPKFLRDSYNVSDIQGTSSKKKVVERPRDPMKLDDITGSQPGWMPRNKRGLKENPPRDILAVADIINVDFKSSRITNVLNPVYTVNGMTHQDDAHSRPAPLHRKKDKPCYALETADIEGASCSDSAKLVIAGIVNEHRRHFRDTNATSDIVGARADTLLHSIRSTRRVDPNVPSYTALDGQRVDSSAVSVGKSIVFASLIREHDIVWHKDDAAAARPYIIASVGNVGLMAVAASEKSSKSGGARRSTAPTLLSTNTSASGVSGGPGSSSTTAPSLSSSSSALRRGGGTPSSDASSKPSSSRLTPAEKKQVLSRQEEIRLVRELC